MVPHRMAPAAFDPLMLERWVGEAWRIAVHAVDSAAVLKVGKAANLSAKPPPTGGQPCGKTAPVRFPKNLLGSGANQIGAVANKFC